MGRILRTAITQGQKPGAPAMRIWSCQSAWSAQTKLSAQKQVRRKRSFLLVSRQKIANKKKSKKQIYKKTEKEKEQKKNRKIKN